MDQATNVGQCSGISVPASSCLPASLQLCPYLNQRQHICTAVNQTAPLKSLEEQSRSQRGRPSPCCQSAPDDALLCWVESHLLLTGLGVSWLGTSSLLHLQSPWRTALPVSSQFLHKHRAPEEKAWMDERLTYVRGYQRDEDLGQLEVGSVVKVAWRGVGAWQRERTLNSNWAPASTGPSIWGGGEFPVMGCSGESLGCQRPFCK